VTSSSVTRSGPHHYVFHSTWDLPAQPERVFTALADLANYPRWWPEFKAARLGSDDHGEFALRSILPITLRFTLDRDLEDPATGLLRARAGGDIDGTVQWELHPASRQGTRVQFTQDVILRHRLAARIDRFIRPTLEWNHRMAMKSGAAGLTEYLHSS
jgi:polyketide cyclase/dehydrase/lipid transport protein